MTPLIIILIASIAVAVAAFAGLLVCFRRVPPGKVLVLTNSAGVRISRQTCFVAPFTATVKRLSLASIPYHQERHGADGLVFGDNIRGDLTLRAAIHFADTDEALIQHIERFGCDRIRHEPVWHELLEEVVVAVMKDTAGAVDFGDAYGNLAGFQARLVQGLEAALKDHQIRFEGIEIELQRTPLDHLDPENILDQEGIRVTQAEMMKCRRESYRVVGATRRFMKGSTVALGIHPVDLDNWVKAANGGGPM